VVWEGRTSDRPPYPDYEYRIDFGPGYRTYFGKDGDRLVILVGGGTKKRQQEDIATASARWQDYKQRKGTER
jgi:putative addiction module killer protein